MPSGVEVEEPGVRNDVPDGSMAEKTKGEGSSRKRTVERLAWLSGQMMTATGPTVHLLAQSQYPARARGWPRYGFGMKGDELARELCCDSLIRRLRADQELL